MRIKEINEYTFRTMFLKLYYTHTSNVIILFLFSWFTNSHQSKMLTIPINVLFLLPVYKTSIIVIPFFSSFASANAPSSKVSTENMSSIIFQFHYFLMEKKNILNYFLQGKNKATLLFRNPTKYTANINLL